MSNSRRGQIPCYSPNSTARLILRGRRREGGKGGGGDNRTNANDRSHTTTVSKKSRRWVGRQQEAGSLTYQAVHKMLTDRQTVNDPGVQATHNASRYAPGVGIAPHVDWWQSVHTINHTHHTYVIIRNHMYETQCLSGAHQRIRRRTNAAPLWGGPLQGLPPPPSSAPPAQ